MVADVSSEVSIYMSKKEQSIRLKERGMSYSDIAKELQLSKWTVAYHCNPKRRESLKKSRKTYTHFHLLAKMNAFFRGKTRQAKPIVTRFNLKQLLSKIGDQPKCYLTGTMIDLSKPETYSLDHIIPVSKGGESCLENCQLVTMQVNYAKQAMSVQEFIALCSAVHGYSGSL